MLRKDNLSYGNIINYLKDNISEERLNHSIRVFKKMTKIGKTYNIDTKDAMYAALFHDAFKEKSIDFLIKYITNYEILDPEEIKMKINLHGIAASLFLYNEIGLQNKDIYNAIRYHTTGRVGMSNLEMCLYLADVVEEERDFPGVKTIRNKIEISLEEGMLCALNESIEFLINSNKNIHLDTLKSRNYFNDLLGKA